MSTAAEEVLAQALKLDPADREMVVAQLMDSLETEPGLSESWEAEIQRRDQEIEEGTAVLLDGDEVMNRLRERLRAASLRVS